MMVILLKVLPVSTYRLQYEYSRQARVSFSGATGCHGVPLSRAFWVQSALYGYSTGGTTHDLQYCTVP
jgi:hypothetical protein